MNKLFLAMIMLAIYGSTRILACSVYRTLGFPTCNKYKTTTEKMSNMAGAISVLLVCCKAL